MCLGLLLPSAFLCCSRDEACEQAHGTLGTVDACVLLASKASDAECLIRRVVERGREPVSVAEPRVRKNIPETARAWAIVGALAGQLRGVLAEVDAMQVMVFFACKCRLLTLLLSRAGFGCCFAAG